MRSRVLIVLLLVPLACAGAERVESDASGALVDPVAPAPYHAEVIALPAPIAVRSLEGPVTPAALDDTDRTRPAVMATGFEGASAACNGWDAEGADAIRSVPPRSGDYACRICATGESPELAIEREAGPVAAGRYTLTAWVRARPHRDAPANATARLEADTDAGLVTATAMAPVAPGDVYAELLVPIELPHGATAIRARIAAVATAAQCVLVDDVVLALAP